MLTHLEIMEEIKKENKKEDKDKNLKYLKSLGEQLLRAICAHLVQINNFSLGIDKSGINLTRRDGDLFWGYVFAGVVKEVDFALPAPMAVSYYKNKFHLILNPIHIRDEYSLTNMIEITRHEGYHLLMKHLTTYKHFFKTSQYRQLMNIATDCEINQLLTELPEGCVTLQTVADIAKIDVSTLKENAGSMYYFNTMLDSMDSEHMCESCQQAINGQGQSSGIGSDEQQDSQDKNEKSQGSGEKNDDSQNDQDESQPRQGQGQQDKDSEQGELEKQLQRGRQLEEMGNQLGKCTCHKKFQDIVDKLPDIDSHDEWFKPNDDSFIPEEEATKSLINGAHRQAMKSRGTMPANLQSLIDKLNMPSQVKWQKIIQRSAGRLTFGKKKSINRLNRRQPMRLDKKGIMNDNADPIVAAIDVSGSVSDKELQYYYNELIHLSTKLNVPLTIMQFDTGIHNVHHNITRFTDELLKIEGRGGTIFQVVFDYLKEQKFSKDTQLFIFTDGGGESSITTYGYNKYQWMLTADQHLSVVDNQRPVHLIEIDRKL